MNLFPSLRKQANPQPTDNLNERLDAAWLVYHAAFAALQHAYGIEARAQALAVCEQATQDLLSIRRKLTGRH